jgi:hypothetical protein
MNSVSALIRALRGPVMLVTLGVLFAFDMNQGWSIRSTWPVLVIAFGAMKLLEAMAPKHQ